MPKCSRRLVPLLFSLLVGACAPTPAPSSSAGVGQQEPKHCGSCHPNHYRDWEGSMHAYASVDPVYRAMVRKSLADTEGRLNQFCLECHQPMATRSNLLPLQEVNGVVTVDLEQPDFRVQQGVVCTSCHTMSHINETQNARFETSNTTFFGPTGSAAANAAHPMEASPLFTDPLQKSMLCGTCHDVLNPNNARLESTFSEWYASDYNAPGSENQQTCGDCHMPAYEGEITEGGRITTLHRHTFVGTDVALIPDFPDKERQLKLVTDLLENTAELTLKQNPNVDGRPALLVSIRNSNAGHNLPSGSTADRQVWVHLKVTDPTGALLYESGMLDANGDLMDRVPGHSLTPHGDPDLLAFGQFIFASDGTTHVNFPWEAHHYDENLLGPGQVAWREYILPEELSEVPLHAVAVLRYRTFPPFLIRKLIDENFLDPEDLEPVPIITMETAELHFTPTPSE